jgi:hypothetical protein
VIPLQLFVASCLGWLQHEQHEIIQYLREENRVLKAQLHHQRLRLTDDDRRRLAALGARLGRRMLARIAARLLCDPFTIGMGGASGKVHTPAGDLDEEQHVQPLEPDGIDGKEIHRDRNSARLRHNSCHNYRCARPGLPVQRLRRNIRTPRARVPATYQHRTQVRFTLSLFGVILQAAQAKPR